MAISPDAVISAASGLGGILVGSGIVGLVIRGKFQAVETLTKDLTSLKDERVVGIEQRMRAFETSCQVKHDRLGETLNKFEHMAANLENMVGWTKKLDTKLDRISEDAAGHRADLEAKREWLHNLDAAHQAHIRDREIHHG